MQASIIDESDESVAQQRPRIADAHCHIASTRFIPQSFVEGVVNNSVLWSPVQRRRMTERYLAKLCDHQCDELVAEMDEAGIDHTVLLCTDFTYVLKDSPLTIAEMLEQHAAVLSRHPGRFSVLAGVDPRWGADGTALFEKAIREYGFGGFKVYPPCGFGPSDPALFPFYEICSANALPVTIHIGATSPALAFDYGRPELVDRAARAFPRVPFILAHGSVAYVEECVMMATFRPNVYIDVSAFESGSVEQLRQIFRRGINHKLLFGTDFPVFRLRGKQEEFIAPLFEQDGALAELSEHDLEGVVAGNAERLFRGVGEAMRAARAVSPG